jgi:PIN domain nuclease of toxin-antitoxin system
MAVYVTDTHPLIWYATGKHKKLSKRVLRAFDRAWNDQALIYVPAVVLWEISLLLKAGVIKLADPFDRWAAALTSRRGFALAPLGIEVIAETINLTFNDDPFDGAIVATARIMDLSLITRDEDITDSKVVAVEW